MLENAEKCNINTTFGYPLHMAVRVNRKKSVRLLLDYRESRGLDINAVDDKGKTHLEIA